MKTPVPSLHLLAALGLLLASLQASASGLEFEHAWIAEAPPVSKVMAGYMDIDNESGKDIAIVAAESQDFGAIEFHRTIEQDGRARMQPQKQLLVPANGELELEPGGYHLMLFRPSRPLRAGDSASIRFSLDNGDSTVVELKVKKTEMDASHDHHHHHH